MSIEQILIDLTGAIKDQTAALREQTAALTGGAAVIANQTIANAKTETPAKAAPKSAPKAAAKATVTEAAPVDGPAAEQEPAEISDEELRAVAFEATKKDRTAAAAAVNVYAEAVSKVQQADRPALMKALEAIVNA